MLKFFFLVFNLPKIKFKIKGYIVLKRFLPARNYGVDFLFSGNNANMKCRCIDMTCSYQVVSVTFFPFKMDFNY